MSGLKPAPGYPSRPAEPRPAGRVWAAMNAHVTILLGIGILVAVIFAASSIRLARDRMASAAVQVVGASGLVMVVLAHLAETFRWLPAMGWGRPDSVGHYLDLVSAIMGVTLLLLGYLAGALHRH